MKYAVVTNSFKRDVSLVERSLRSSLAQSPAPECVIFIDQNDEPLVFAFDVASNPKLKHLHVRVSAVSKARNSFEIPQVEWLVFCDDDGYFDASYAQVFTSFVAQNPELEIVAGSIVRDDNGEFYSPRHKIGGDLMKFKNTKLLMGSNFAVKAKTFQKLGGFDESFGAGAYWGSGEETDFAWKAYFARVPMAFNPEMKVLHVRPYAGDFSHSCKKAYRYGQGKGALVAKWLFAKKRPLVLLELLEMLVLPCAQMLLALIRLKPQMTIVYLCALAGRITGFLRAVSF